MPTNIIFFKLMGLIFYMLIFTLNIFSQTFEKYYGGIQDEEGNAVAETVEGGFIIVGYTESFGAGSRDFYVARVNNYGDTVWTRTFGKSTFDVAYDIVATDSSHYLVGGYIGTNDGDIYLVKINDDGDTLWTKAIDIEHNEHLRKIKMTHDGGFIICGDILTSAWRYKYLLVRTNSSGDTLWTKAYEYGTAYSIDLTDDGGYILAVNPFEVPDFTNDFLLVKTNAGGEIEWTKTFFGQDVEVPYAVEQTSDGGYIMAGRTDTYGAGGSDFYLLKTNSSGDSLWAATYGGEADERAFAVIQTSDGGYLMAGYTFADPGQFFDFYLIKTDENGNLLWDRTYGGVWQEMAYDIKETEDGYVVAGYTQSYGNGGFEMYLVKTDKNGLVSINDDNGSNLISEFTLFQNFPNPFNPSTTINFIIPNKAYTTLRIYDVLGRKVQTLFEAELSSGSHHIVFNASFISSGIYFYQLNTGDFSQTKKMILLR